MATQSGRKLILGAAIAGIAYIAAGILGLQLTFVHSSASPIWLPTGIAIAAMAILGLRTWPIFFLGAAAFNYWNGSPMGLSLAIGFGNMLEGALGAWALTNICGGLRAFERAPTALAYSLLAGAGATAMSATIGVSSLVAFGVAPTSAFWAIWTTWWLGDMGGAIVVAPAIVMWFQRRPRPSTLALPAVAAAAATAILFGPWLQNLQAWLLAPLLLTLFTWLILRYSPRVTSAALLIIGGGAVLATIRASGPLYTGDENQALLNLQLFLVWTSTAVIVLAAGRRAMRDVEPTQDAPRARTGRWVPITLALVPLLIAATAVAGPITSGQEATETARMQNHVDAIVGSWDNVLDQQVGRLAGLAGLYATGPQSGAELQAYVEESAWLDVSGATAVAFVTLVPEGQEEAFIQQRRAEAHPSADVAANFTTFPESDRYPKYVVTHLVPYAGNAAALGLDIGHEPTRRATAELAITSGEAQASGAIVLAQTEGEFGFLIMYPIYQGGVPIGIVDTVHRIPVLAAAVAESVYQSTGVAAQFRISQAGQDFATVGVIEGATEERSLNVAGQTWRLEIVRPPDLATLQERSLPGAMITTGGALTVAFSGVVYAYDSTRRRAYELAEEILETADEAERRRVALDHAEDVNRFKTDFLNMAAHELRTPLVPMRAQLFLLRKQLTRDQIDAPALNVLDRNVERISRMVDDLLQASRAQSGKLFVEPQPMDPTPMIAEAVGEYAPAADGAGVDLQYHTEGAGNVLVDPGRFSRVVANLVGNAIKFTPKGGTVSVRSTIGAQWTLQVQDSGLGITPSKLAELFQPFSQVHEPGEVTEPGSGLGLYICRTIVERHGGRIELTSDGVGHGVTATVTLPVMADEAVAAWHAARPDPDEDEVPGIS